MTRCQDRFSATTKPPPIFSLLPSLRFPPLSLSSPGELITLSSAAISTNLHPIMLSLSASSSATTNPHSRPPPHVHQHCFLSPPPSALSLLSSSSSSPRHLRLSLRCSAAVNGSRNLNSGAGIFAGEGFNSASNDDGEKKTNYKMKIAIVGFGNFGQFLAKEIVKQGHTVLAYSRSDYSRVAGEIGVQFFSDADDLCEEHPEVILLCTSILSTEKVLRGLPVNRLRRSTLFVDVLSVKEFPRSLFLQLLPPDFDILCTHPMFGPDSGKAGWGGLPFVFDKVRVGSDPARVTRVEAFLDVFRAAGCRMVEMSCAEHDRYAAGSQFITHMMGRVLEKLGLGNTPINTKGYESLLNLVDNTARDSFELFYGLFLYNKNAMEQLERMDWAFEMVKKQLSGHLHGLVRKQLMLETNCSGNDDVNVGDRNSKPMMLPAPTAHTKIVPEKQQQQQHDLVVNGSSNLR